MALTFSLFLPTGFGQELASFNELVQAFETLTGLAATAEQSGFEAMGDMYVQLRRGQPVDARVRALRR